MVSVLATVRLTASNGNPEDNMTIDTAWNLDTFTSTDADNLATDLASFFNTVQVIPGTDHAVADTISAAYSRAANACVIDMYNITGFLNGAPHGSPTYVRSFTLGAADAAIGSPYPAEVAVKVSAHGDLDGVLERVGATRPAARRRGGFFIGGQASGFATVTNGQPRPSTTLMDTYAAAALTLSGAQGGGWSIWSRADAALYEVVGGWVDNAYDTIRKRGVEYSARTIWADA